MAQKVPISGVIVVSTPNELSLIDARRAVDMYAKVDAKILGVVENMSYFSADGGKTKHFPFANARKRVRETVRRGRFSRGADFGRRQSRW